MAQSKSASAQVLLVSRESCLAGLIKSVSYHYRTTIETVGNCCGALKRIRDATFDCIVLDLRLPDMTDLKFLSDLQTANDRIPIVLTPWPDRGSGRMLGYREFTGQLAKQVGVALSAALATKAVVSAPGDRLISSRSGVSGGRQGSGPSPTVESVLARLAHGGRTSAEPARDSAALLNALIGASLDARGTSLTHFALLARVVRAKFGDLDGSLKAARQALEIFPQLPRPGLWHPNSADASMLDLFEHARDLREVEIAHELHVDPATVGRRLRRVSGCSFRELRWAALIRPAVAPVARSSEPIANIAIDCDYSTEDLIPQFYRDWLHVVGITPGQFRERTLAGYRLRSAYATPSFSLKSS